MLQPELMPQLLLVPVPMLELGPLPQLGLMPKPMDLIALQLQHRPNLVLQLKLMLEPELMLEPMPQLLPMPMPMLVHPLDLARQPKLVPAPENQPMAPPLPKQERLHQVAESPQLGPEQLPFHQVERQRLQLKDPLHLAAFS